LCCSTWLNSFKSVSTNAARTQQLSLNPQKLAGQCSKLKCCLNFENDLYLETLKELPPTTVKLLTKSGVAIFQKMDVLNKVLWFAYENDQNNLFSVPLLKVNEIIEMNSKGIMADDLKNETVEPATKTKSFNYLNEEDDIHRFDKK
jgi:cell fate regulator YaaT (PSP1 superfamily)